MNHQNQTTETLESPQTPPRPAVESPRQSQNASDVLRPCRTAWQQKWLRLDVTRPGVQRMADKVEALAARFFNNNPKPALLVLTGASGTGKTHCADALSLWVRYAGRAAWETGKWGSLLPSALSLKWPEVTDGFKNGMYGVIEDCENAALLVLDDVGAEHDPSRNAADKLCQILSRREKRFTLITTNIAPAAWPERFDVRIADRLMRNSAVVDLSGVESYATRDS